MGKITSVQRKYNFTEVWWEIDPVNRQHVKVTIRFFPIHRIGDEGTFGWVGKYGATTHMLVNIPVPPNIDKFTKEHLISAVYSTTKSLPSFGCYDEFGRLVEKKVKGVIAPTVQNHTGKNVVVDQWNFVTGVWFLQTLEIVTKTQGVSPVILFTYNVGDGYLERKEDLLVGHISTHIQTVTYVPSTTQNPSPTDHLRVKRKFDTIMSKVKEQTREVLLDVTEEFTHTYLKHFIGSFEKHLRSIVSMVDEKIRPFILSIPDQITITTLETLKSETEEESVITVTGGEADKQRLVVFVAYFDISFLPIAEKLMEEDDEVELLKSLSLYIGLGARSRGMNYSELVDLVDYLTKWK